MRVLLQDGRIGVCDVTPWLFKDMRWFADHGHGTIKLFVKIGFMSIVQVDIRFLEPTDREAA